MSPPDLTQLHPPHQKALQRAFLLLENPNFAARLADYAGQPADRVLRVVPRAASRRFNRIIEAAILRCLAVAIHSIEPTATTPPATRASSVLAGLTGGVSGFFGFAALPLELPVTTTLMLRAIADVARYLGEDLTSLDARLACVEVFGLGAGRSRGRMDVGYYASRALLSRLAGDASTLLLERGAAGVSAPVVNRLVAEVASRFGVVVSERFAASALPVLGAVGGATINVIFMNHFQRIALGHFTIRRLERRYGPHLVRRHYDALSVRDGARPRLSGT
ncbi:MAG TPA: EcsC family protein [Xanthobacteraceae bacterium]|nr:EcsC family protein [Xanthobacteraceae bacterium]